MLSGVGYIHYVFYPDDEQELVASTALPDAQQQKPILEKGGGADSARLNPTRSILVEDVSDKNSIGMKVQPQQKVGGETNSVTSNSSQPISVEDVSDDEDEDLRELMSPLRNQTPSEGEWMEPISTQSATTAATVPAINENSCSVHDMKVLQQHSWKRNNKNRNRKRILGMMRYTHHRKTR